MRRILIVVLLALLAAACGAGIDENATGEEIYDGLCARCHGGDLSGGVGPALASGSEAAGQPYGFYLQTIERGLGRMPSYGGTLSAAQTERVVAYVFEVQGRPVPGD